MNKFGLLIAGLLFSLNTWASESLDPLLNKVTVQFKAEQWIKTKTALINIAINASVTDQGIEKIQADVMQKLNQIAAGEWHVVSFNRQQDKSDLESIQIMAQARLPQSSLANLRAKAKSISRPGETFSIDTVQFTPSDDEIKAGETLLRNNIYQQAKMEIDSLNKLYPDQKYYLHQIDFIAGPAAPVPMAQQGEMYMAKMARASAAPPLSVGNKQELLATVVLASMPDTLTKSTRVSL